MAVALEHDVHVDTVRAIIRARQLTPPAAARALETWPRRLHIHTFGDFSIYRDGERLGFSRKAPQKPLELLKALIAFGGRGVGIERLKDALWPEAEGDKSQQSFEITLHRLRKVLGVDGALIAGENRLTLSSDHCWVDLWELEQVIGELGDIVAYRVPRGPMTGWRNSPDGCSTFIGAGSWTRSRSAVGEGGGTADGLRTAASVGNWGACGRAAVTGIWPTRARTRPATSRGTHGRARGGGGADSAAGGRAASARRRAGRCDERAARHARNFGRLRGRGTR